MENMAGSEDAADSVRKIEIELLRLVRHLETFGRNSDLYTRVDRAGYLALRTLDEFGAMNANALSEMLHLDASTVTRQLAAMQAGGLAERRPDHVDRRSSVVVLTATGRQVMRSVARKRRRLITTLTKDWTKEGRDSFIQMAAMLNASLIEHDDTLHGTRRPTSSIRQGKSDQHE
jgi:DNA-binding MarR family transcriptional regulator